ncbi:type II toxin-antitoxin system RelE/ParE family toxin [Cryomorpha ignava]|uniref:Type II toxin-antitoxin system RelE/ParE family toxin n=1 Tax=Cryomorpha ignava TaxID=101383 RepID=A0A7K3WTE4_9FLAO|nr:type II toxin-antitoxin system RelE/ParE family toxin [Cryomorpha ignava]NEN24963.1 type II toxin-antitoxin system RelE/ParE family toxin [Cryomorpha ignava]
MNNLKLTPQAEKDLAENFEFTFHKWGITQAEKYQDELYEGFKVISHNKSLGKVYQLNKIRYRVLPINQHLIFYRTLIEMVIVVLFTMTVWTLRIKLPDICLNLPHL